jgi:hypothetical protein
LFSAVLFYTIHHQSVPSTGEQKKKGREKKSKQNGMKKEKKRWGKKGKKAEKRREGRKEKNARRIKAATESARPSRPRSVCGCT